MGQVPWGQLPCSTWVVHTPWLGKSSYKGEPGIHWAVLNLSKGSVVQFALKAIECIEPAKTGSGKSGPKDSSCNVQSHFPGRLRKQAEGRGVHSQLGRGEALGLVQ